MDVSKEQDRELGPMGQALLSVGAHGAGPPVSWGRWGRASRQLGQMGQGLQISPVWEQGDEGDPYGNKGEMRRMRSSMCHLLGQGPTSLLTCSLKHTTHLNATRSHGHVAWFTITCTYISSV